MFAPPGETELNALILKSTGSLSDWFSVRRWLAGWLAGSDLNE